MSEFRWEHGTDAKSTRYQTLTVFRNPMGGIAVTALGADRLKPWTVSVSVDLPASDARRLRDWLNERYPVTETGETK